MPPRQIRVFLPPGSGFTQANIAKLEHVSRMLKNSIFNNAEKNEIRMENLMPILRRVVNAGHYPNMASAARASAKYAARYKKLRNNGRNIGAERNAGAWRKVQNAAGRFRALHGVAEVRGDDATCDEVHVRGGERLAEEDVGVERMVRADDHLVV